MSELDAHLSRRWSRANGAAMVAAAMRVQTELALAHSRERIERSRELLRQSCYPCSYANMPFET